MDIQAAFIERKTFADRDYNSAAQFVPTLQKLKIWRALQEYEEVTGQALAKMLGKTDASRVTAIIPGLSRLTPIYEYDAPVSTRKKIIVLGLLDTNYWFDPLEEYARSIGGAALTDRDRDIIGKYSVYSIINRYMGRS